MVGDKDNIEKLAKYFSDKEGIFQDTSEDNDTSYGKRRKTRLMTYDTITFDPYFQVDMIFSSRDEFKKALTQYSVKNINNLKVVKNDRVKVRVIYNDKACR